MKNVSQGDRLITRAYADSLTRGEKGERKLRGKTPDWNGIVTTYGIDHVSLISSLCEFGVHSYCTEYEQTS